MTGILPPGGVITVPLSPTIIPQCLPCSPVYSVVGVQEYVLWKPTMFLHYFNDSDVDVALVVSSAEPDLEGSYGCYVASLLANDETILGPFDCIYSPIISITKAVCNYSTDVTVAALYTDYLYPIEVAELATVDGVLSTTPTILAGVLPSATVEIGG